MKKYRYGLMALLAALVVAAGCAPAAAPAPAPAPQAAPAAPALSLEDVAWAKVVEAAKKEGKVTGYIFSWVGDIGLAIEKAFENRYGINLEIITGRGAEFGERLKLERRIGQMVGDTTEGSSGLMNSMKIDGLLTSVSADLPVFQEKDVWRVHPAFLDPVDKALLGFRFSIATPWINTNLVKRGEEPSSWRDLLEPKWKGKMSLREPRVNAAFLADITGLLDKKVWDEEYMRALHRQELKYILSPREEAVMLSRGEIHLNVLGSSATASPLVAEGAPIRALTMKEGESASLGTIAAITNSPHPNATRVFLNWVFSQEGQAAVGKAMSNHMLRRDVPNFEPLDAQTKMVNPSIVTPEYLEVGTRRFRDRWYDKVVGR